MRRLPHGPIVGGARRVGLLMTRHVVSAAVRVALASTICLLVVIALTFAIWLLSPHPVRSYDVQLPTLSGEATP